MHILSFIILSLATVLLLLTQLLFSFSYDTLIPKEMSFGIYIFVTYLLIAYFSREAYFSIAERSKTKKLMYINAPSYLTVLIGIIILFNFKISFPTAGSDAPTGMWVIGLVVYGTLFIILLVISALIYYSAKKKYNLIHNYKKLNRLTSISSTIKKSALIMIPALFTGIFYISFLIYSDYSTAGMKKSYTSKTNSNQMHKKMIKGQDITFCDRIINSSEWDIKGCYIEYFDQIKLISEYHNEKITNKNYSVNFFELYNKLKKEQCDRTKKTALCLDILLEKTSEILESNAHVRDKIYFSSISISNVNEVPRFLIIELMRRNDSYKLEGMYELYARDLNENLFHSIASIKKLNNGKNDRVHTQIVLDINKLIKNQEELRKIQKIIQKTERKVVKKYRLAQEELRIRKRKFLEKNRKSKFDYIAGCNNESNDIGPDSPECVDWKIVNIPTLTNLNSRHSQKSKCFSIFAKKHVNEESIKSYRRCLRIKMKARENGEDLLGPTNCFDDEGNRPCPLKKDL